jgi:hypothetical protein
VQGVVNTRSRETGEVATEAVEKLWQAIADEGFTTEGIAFHAAQDLLTDITRLEAMQRGLSERGFPGLKAIAETKVGIEKMTSGTKDAGDF